MKNQKSISILTTIFSIAFAFILCLSSAQDASAQRYLTEIKNTSEVNNIAQFAEKLSNFLELAQKIETDGVVRPAELARLEAAGKNVKDGTSNFRSNLKNLVTNFKNKNQWDEELDSQINESLGSRKIKAFFQKNGGRKILTDADGAIDGLNAQIDAIIANAKKDRVANISGENLFLRTSFASNASGRKLRLRCVVLGVAIFIAEIKKAPKTAENLDGIFDQSCGAGANTAT
jgi:hypothetical protein